MTTSSAHRGADRREDCEGTDFIHHDTDGPDNPYSRVYDLRRVRRDFPLFEVRHAEKRFMHAPPLRVHDMTGERLLGWHLWVHLTPTGDQRQARPGT